MPEDIVKKEESHSPKKECEFDLADGVIIAILSKSNKKQKEESK